MTLNQHVSKHWILSVVFTFECIRRLWSPVWRVPLVSSNHSRMRDVCVLTRIHLATYSASMFLPSQRGLTSRLDPFQHHSGFVVKPRTTLTNCCSFQGVLIQIKLLDGKKQKQAFATQALEGWGEVVGPPKRRMKVAWDLLDDRGCWNTQSIASVFQNAIYLFICKTR